MTRITVQVDGAGCSHPVTIDAAPLFQKDQVGNLARRVILTAAGV